MTYSLEKRMFAVLHHKHMEFSCRQTASSQGVSKSSVSRWTSLFDRTKAVVNKPSKTQKDSKVPQLCGLVASLVAADPFATIARIQWTLQSLLLAIDRNGVVAHCIKKGSFNTISFTDFVSSLPHGRPLIMDNVAFHRSKSVKDVAQANCSTVLSVVQSGRTRLFCGPYSTRSLSRNCKTPQVWHGYRLVASLNIQLALPIEHCAPQQSNDQGRQVHVGSGAAGGQGRKVVRIRRRAQALRTKVRNVVRDLHRKTCVLLCRNFTKIFLPTLDTVALTHVGNRVINNKQSTVNQIYRLTQSGTSLNG